MFAEIGIVVTYHKTASAGESINVEKYSLMRQITAIPILSGLLIAGLLSGCAAPMHRYVYEPTEVSAERLAPGEATSTVESMFSDCKACVACTPYTRRIKVYPDHYEMTPSAEGGNPPTTRVQFEDIGNLTMTTFDSFDSPNFYTLGDVSGGDPTKQRTLLGSCVGGSSWSVDSAHRLADALLKLKLDDEKRIVQEDNKFAQVAVEYRNAAVKPVFPEEARKYKVQAESALRDKQFGQASALYAQALDLAPWWPEGHFNRALILGETGIYRSAIREMKRYLILVPGASNARTAQDKVYEWERKGASISN